MIGLDKLKKLIVGNFLKRKRYWQKCDFMKVGPTLYLGYGKQ